MSGFSSINFKQHAAEVEHILSASSSRPLRATIGSPSFIYTTTWILKESMEFFSTSGSVLPLEALENSNNNTSIQHRSAAVSGRFGPKKTIQTSVLIF